MDWFSKSVWHGASKLDTEDSWLVWAGMKIIKLLKRSISSRQTFLFSGKNRVRIVNIRRDIFQGDSLSLLLFVVALILVTVILITLKQWYSFAKGKEKLNHLLFMDDLKLCASNDNEIDSSVKVIKIVSGNIGMQFGWNTVWIWHMCFA